MSHKYYIIAGEASGDLHGSNLMKGIYDRDPQAHIRFWGGGLMDSVFRSHCDKTCRDGGDGLVQDYREGAVMGFVEVLAKAGKIVRRLKECRQDIAQWKPDVVILIDYPGFNLRIAEFAHKAGFKVFYYIAPKVWASRESRVRKIRKWVDRLFIIFPFEIPYFTEKGITFSYKGNPLVDAVDNSPAMNEERGEFLGRHGIPEGKYIAILAGSRKSEISRTMPVAMEFADRMHALPEYAGWRFIVAGAPARSQEDYMQYIGGREYVKLVFSDTYAVLHNAETAVINSGTASLEAALIGTPQVVVWSTSSFSAFIGRNILHVLDHIRFISLGNLIDDSLVFRELIQEDFTAENVTAEIRRLIEDLPYRSAMLDGYARIRESLGGRGASAAVAEAMLECLEGDGASRP